MTDRERKIREEDVFEDTGMRVLGPALDGFVRWILQNALDRGIKRLYFLSRDGYLMYLAAKVYIEKSALPLECRYLSCSRYSLRLPVLHLDREEALDYLCRHSIAVSLARIMERAGLDDREQTRVLAEIGEEGKGNEPIPYAGMEGIRKKLEGSDVFWETAGRHSKEALPALQGYLRQEGLLDGTRAALVDSGWVGSMQKTLNRILADMGREAELEGFYWGLYELPPGVERKHYHCYYFSPEGQLREKVFFNNNLFEAIFSAPHGMTMRYEEREGSYVPVYAPVTAERRGQTQRLGTVLLRYVKESACRSRAIESVGCEREKRALRKKLGRFMGKPEPEEAEVYGRMHFCDDVVEYGSRSLAPKMEEEALKANHAVNKILVMAGFRQGEIRESAWYEGSAVRSSRKPGMHLFRYRIYKYLLYIRQMYRWRKKDHVQKKTEKQKI